MADPRQGPTFGGRFQVRPQPANRVRDVAPPRTTRSETLDDAATHAGCPTAER